VEEQRSASAFPRAQNSKEESKSADIPDSGSRTVLLVEDNPTDVFVMKEALEACGLGLQVRIARNGQDALLYFEELARVENAPCPVLVLLDLNLPRVDGVEVLRQIRSSLRCQRTPVIVVTSSTAEVDRAAVQRLGAEAYFEKPRKLVGYTELTQVIRRVLGGREESPE